MLFSLIPLLSKAALNMKRTSRIWPHDFNCVTPMNWFNTDLNGKTFVLFF